MRVGKLSEKTKSFERCQRKNSSGNQKCQGCWKTLRKPKVRSETQYEISWSDEV